MVRAMSAADVTLRRSRQDKAYTDDPNVVAPRDLVQRLLEEEYVLMVVEHRHGDMRRRRGIQTYLELSWQVHIYVLLHAQDCSRGRNFRHRRNRMHRSLRFENGHRT